MSLLRILLSTAAMTTAVALPDGSEASDAPLDEVTVEGRRVANDQPAGTYAAPATGLRFDPRTELQSRGMPEGQADVTVRGGLFENTGFRVGAVTVFDPQTGHYVAELPVDPAWLGSANVTTGITNALLGFNSNIATVTYDLDSALAGDKVVRAGFGTHGLAFQSLRLGGEVARTENAITAVGLSLARSQGDGTVPGGDHEFTRVNLRASRLADSSRSDLVLAWQDKFYGWPGAYTGFADFLETDETQTAMVLVNHRQESGDGAGWWNVSAYYRDLEDDYDFDRTTRESGGPGAFEHRTRVMALGFNGSAVKGPVDLRYSAQITADELVRSTDLTGGAFDDRTYLALAFVPEFELADNGTRSLRLRAGLTGDFSNRDTGAVLPQLGLRLERTGTVARHTVDLQFAATSQVPGYTVLQSGPSGLFGGNRSLGCERATALSLGWTRTSRDSEISTTAFYRYDDDLVDWTFDQTSPFARQANAVDLDVFGIEVLAWHQRDKVRIGGGYTWIEKDEDYGDASVDASYYALNFARHRLTLSLALTLAERFELRLDNEYRAQNANPLRVGDGTVYLAAASLRWSAQRVEGLEAQLTVDNLTDSAFQPFPGTPAVGRQITLSAGYRW